MISNANQLREKEDYQRLILEKLEKNDGYQIRIAKDHYNRAFAMDPELLIRFIKDTQSEEYSKFQKRYKENTDQTILNVINNEINSSTGGRLNVLKNGVEFEKNLKLELMYRKPATSFNPKATELYNKNIFSVMEEVYHKEDERIDLVIFINGLAIFAIELKCNTAGQYVDDAIDQYKTMRDHRTALLKYKSGVFVSFAMDLNEVYMCTYLKGRESYFLPFNRGDEKTGKGNPQNDDGLNVSYMWDDIFKKGTVMDLIEKFIFIKVETKTDDKTGKRTNVETLIFPRYHQLDAVRNVLTDMVDNGSDRNYLIEHSAGSGKTNTIAWLAHRLISLHDKDDKNIFDQVIIMTDRVVVDRQLQSAIKAIEHKSGLIRMMDDGCSSADLTEALNSNIKIVGTTIQKFSYVYEGLSKSRSKRFAVIIDEAHASTSGKYMASVSKALSKEEEEVDAIDIIADDMKRYGKQENVSMIAFTATPNGKTYSIFGQASHVGEQGKIAFHKYSMHQAIEEGFILNVLDNYTTYHTYCHINKIVENDPELKSKRAVQKILYEISVNEDNISQKVEIIVDNFSSSIMNQLDGMAKGMIVTSSRLAAVKYKLILDEYVKNNDIKGIRALVAFTGTVSLDGKEYTEQSMNGIKERDLPTEFNKDTYNLLIVADKYQTGFDQPKLCAMYVDKTLKDINAVQTLSRLNRVMKGYEKKTFIIDFKNDYATIESAFSKYFKCAFLAESVNPGSIRRLEDEIDDYDILSSDDIDEFNDLLYQESRSSADKQRMWVLLGRAYSKVKILEKPEQKELRSAINKFLRFYCFLIQATNCHDVELHKKYNYLSYLVKMINVDRDTDFDIADKISITDFRQKKMKEVRSPEMSSDPEVHINVPGKRCLEEEDFKLLSKIIEDINDAFSKNFDQNFAADSISKLKDSLLKDERLKQSAKSNDIRDFEISFKDRVSEKLGDNYYQNEEFYTFLLNHDGFVQRIADVLLKGVYHELKKEE